MQLRHPVSRRDGAALPVALLAILVIGALVTGGFYSSSQESRISVSADLGSQAFYVAEYGLQDALGTWKNLKLEAVDSVAVDSAEALLQSSDTAGTFQTTIRRLGHRLFMIRSEGRVEAGAGREAVREVAAVVRTMSPTMPAITALAVYGGLDVGGSSEIRGADAGGPGCTPGDTVPGVTAYDSSLVSQGNGKSKKPHITGDPPVTQDASLDTATLSRFGDVTLQDLIDSATKIYDAGESENGMAPDSVLGANGQWVCDTFERGNWGNPGGEGACGDELPIIYARGDLHLKTGEGQGILIVEGDLKATGNFEFYGIVIVKGELEASGTGNHLEGSVILHGDGSLSSESTTKGNALVQYSKCRVDRAFDSSLRPSPLSARSWIDLSATTSGGI